MWFGVGVCTYVCVYLWMNSFELSIPDVNMVWLLNGFT